MSRLPIKARITAAFALAMAIVLAALALFIHSQHRAQLDESLEVSLRSRAAEVSALARASDPGLGATGDRAPIEQDESFAQILTAAGELVDSTTQLGDVPVLDGTELERAAAEPSFFEHSELPGIEGQARLLATPVDAGGERLVAVVGASLDDRNEALANLAKLLVGGGVGALLLASLAGYAAAAAALRPVERMRTRARTISAGEPGERLPVSGAGDELTRLGETLNAMLGRLETALERERRFVDDASHELRTPLALHKTELELALRYGSSEAELREAIGSAVDEIDRVIQLAEGLLVVARYGKLAIEPEAIPAEDLFGAVAARFRSRSTQLGRSLVCDDADGIRVAGDRAQLERALMGMVDNAFGHGSGEVRLRAVRTDDRVELHVHDRGPGFPADFIERAFERFSRADAARGRGGSGLGLAIVETIAAAHGGSAHASNGGAGADVWIEIPAA